MPGLRSHLCFELLAIYLYTRIFRARYAQDRHAACTNVKSNYAITVMNSSSSANNPIQQHLTVPVSADQAFEVFVKELNSWWPKEYTWAGEELDRIAIEPNENGRCFERGPHGFECDWGRVLEYSPPHRIVFTWQIGPDRVPQPSAEKASEIEVLFESEDNRTGVTFIHRNFEKHGEGAEVYKEALGSPQGWPYILNNFKEAISNR